jgi:DNA-binding response OmpR family regulator
MNKYRVLLVEHDTTIVELLRLFLEQQGYEVIVEVRKAFFSYRLACEVWART